MTPTRTAHPGWIAVVVAIAGVLGYLLLAPATSTSTPDPQRPVGRADGLVPDGVTVLDEGFPAVDRLDPDLLTALRRAARAAGRGGVEFTVNSGWRSQAYQAQLLREAVATHGSEEEAARWVATPQTSPHVSGEAVDLGSAAATWLAARGDAYGLCQVYDNEPWHYELRPAAARRGCPDRYPDPTADPRMGR